MCSADSRRDRGFTLVEMLVVTSIVMAVFMSVTVSLFQGLQFFQRLDGTAKAIDTAFFFEKLTSDLRSATASSDITASRDGSIRFSGLLPTPVFTDAALNLAHARGVEIHYWLDGETGRVFRKQSDPQYHSADEKTDLMLENVHALAFALNDENQGKINCVSVEFSQNNHNRLLDYKKDIRIPSRYAAAFKS